VGWGSAAVGRQGARQDEALWFGVGCLMGSQRGPSPAVGKVPEEQTCCGWGIWAEWRAETRQRQTRATGKAGTGLTCSTGWFQAPVYKNIPLRQSPNWWSVSTHLDVTAVQPKTP